LQKFLQKAFKKNAKKLKIFRKKFRKIFRKKVPEKVSKFSQISPVRSPKKFSATFQQKPWHQFFEISPKNKNQKSFPKKIRTNFATRHSIQNSGFSQNFARTPQKF